VVFKAYVSFPGGSYIPSILLTADFGTGVMRRVDAGYELSVQAAKKFGIKIPMMK